VDQAHDVEPVTGGPDDRPEEETPTEGLPCRIVSAVLAQAVTCLAHEVLVSLFKVDDRTEGRRRDDEDREGEGVLPSILRPVVARGLEALACWAVGRGSGRLLGGVLRRWARRLL
jgi:hypothetical protein